MQNVSLESEGTIPYLHLTVRRNQNSDSVCRRPFPSYTISAFVLIYLITFRSQSDLRMFSLFNYSQGVEMVLVGMEQTHMGI